MKNLGAMMKQVQEMQARMQEMQERLDGMEIEGRSAAGWSASCCRARAR